VKPEPGLPWTQTTWREPGSLVNVTEMWLTSVTAEFETNVGSAPAGIAAKPAVENLAAPSTANAIPLAERARTPMPLALFPSTPVPADALDPVAGPLAERITPGDTADADAHPIRDALDGMCVTVGNCGDCAATACPDHLVLDEERVAGGRSRGGGHRRRAEYHQGRAEDAREPTAGARLAVTFDRVARVAVPGHSRSASADAQ
jgi:hypothetical protein